MDRTRAPGSVDNRYIDEDRNQGVQGTALVAEDRNAVQEELIRLIEAGGLVPDRGNDGQAAASVRALIAVSDAMNAQLIADGDAANAQAIVDGDTANADGIAALDASAAKISGNQTIAGDKTFQGRTTLAGGAVDAQGVAVSCPPVGATYLQFPDTVTPEALWNGTDWTLILNNDAYGLFFRTEGAYAAAFGGGVQGWAIQNHGHTYRVGNAVKGHDYNVTGGQFWYSTVRNRTTSGAGTVETRPRNVTVRIWRRDA